MLPQLEDWLSRHSDRVFARQTSQVETAKLLVTFSLAVAATVVATALQVDPVTLIDLIAAVLLAVAFGYTVWAIGLDNLHEPDRTAAEELAQRRQWPDWFLLEHLQYLARRAEDFNEEVARRVRTAAKYQLLIASAAGLAGGVSLLVPAA